MRVARNEGRDLTKLLMGGLRRTVTSLMRGLLMSLDCSISDRTTTTSLPLLTLFRMCSTAMATAFGTLFLVMMLATNAMASDAKDTYQPFEHFRDCDVCSEMVVLPSGRYMMGSTADEFAGKDQYHIMFTDETPRHETAVKSFALAKFDVTKKLFEIFVNETGFSGKGCQIFNGKEWVSDANADWKNPGFVQTEQDPVVCVSWNDAQKFIAWINSKKSSINSHKYRLPTEAEWEYAARAGTATPMYWGSDRSKQCEFENTRDLSKQRISPIGPYANCDSGYTNTSPVGSFRPNPWGLFDILGNVHQWVSDCNSVGYAAPPPATPELMAISCSFRRARGGSWASIPIGVRAASRSGYKIDTRESVIGFRLAVDLLN
jgi:formylglycine-generating enzyme required for sulfatase activity